MVLNDITVVSGITGGGQVGFSVGNKVIIYGVNDVVYTAEHKRARCDSRGNSRDRSGYGCHDNAHNHPDYGADNCAYNIPEYVPPPRSRRVDVHYRVVVAICIQVQTVYRIGVGVFKRILRDKPTDNGVVITSYEVVKLKSLVIVITAITERVNVADKACESVFRAVGIENFVFTPSVVSISCHDCAVLVKQCDDVSLRVLTVEIRFNGRIAIIDNSR